MMASRREVGGDIQADQGAPSPPVAWCLPIPASRAGIVAEPDPVPAASAATCTPYGPATKPSPTSDPHRPSHGPGRRPHPHLNRLRAQLTGVFPGLERALDLTNTGPLVLTGYQTPAALRRTGKKRLET